jgi:undecaprenyl-diphosphatase
MSLLESVICGIIQGLAEFLPISSSGHLAIAHALFNMSDPEGNLTFDLLLHLGTLIVVFMFYYKEIFSLVPAFFTMLKKVFCGKLCLKDWTKNERFVLLLIIATLPLAFALFFKDRVEMLSAYPKVVGGILIFNGFVLLFADYMAKRVNKRELSPLGAFGVGIFQLAATLPGLSRSGSTISGGLLFGLEREDAVKFSFIMSVPAILGANILNIPDAFSAPVASGELGLYLIGMAVAMISGFCAMKFLIYISRKSKFGFFAYYCMAAGLLTVIFG